MKASSQRSILSAGLALFLCATIWGGCFVFQKIAMDHLPPLIFNALRCMVSAVLVFAIYIGSQYVSRAQRIWMTKNEIAAGAHLGVWLWLALGFQQEGIVETTAFRAAFITGLYVVFVPFVMQILVVKAVTSWQLILVGLAGLGVFLLASSDGLGRAGFNHGDVWVMLGAVFWAVHLGVLARSKMIGRILPLAFMQMFVAAMLSASSSWVLSEKWQWGDVQAVLWALMYAGVMSGGIAYVLQIYGQGRVAPPVAAVILSLEGIVGGLGGWYFLHENFNERNLVGAGLIMLMIVVVEASNYFQFDSSRRTRSES